MEEIISAILSDIEKIGVKSTEAFIEAVLKRLLTFGYMLSVEDEWLIAFCIQKVNMHIMNSCNTLSVPEGLFYVAVDRVCGEFLISMKNSGRLKLENIDLDTAITQIHEGDTTIQFAAGQSDEEKFTKFVNYLITQGVGDEICYRKLMW